MKMNEHGLKIIKYFEGCFTTAYKCPAGLMTIGYGHVLEKGEPRQITQKQAEKLLVDDVADFEKGVTQLLERWTSDNQFSALVVFAFNCGLTALSESTLLKLHNQGKTREASLEFDRWNKSTINGKKKVLEGLVTRRNAEEALYNGDIKGLEKIIGK